MLQKETAAAAVYVVRECMELMGPMGYLEDGVLPKLMRDLLVLSTWEATGNLMVMDMLDIALKSEGLSEVLEEIQRQFQDSTKTTIAVDNWELLIAKFNELVELLDQLPQFAKDESAVMAKVAFEQLTKFYQLAAMLYYYDADTAVWLEPAIQSQIAQFFNAPAIKDIKLPTVETIEQLISWKF